MRRVVEIRSYKLKPGTGGAFHALVSRQSVPLHEIAGIDVVTHGQSLHDPDAYYLIRSYESMDHLRSSQEAFYASAAWRQGPRQAIVELIESDTNAVMWLAAEAIDALHDRPPRSAPDL
jgi:hypothetical protein